MMKYEEKVKITLEHMTPGKWTSPSEIGGLFGGHSSVGTPLCKMMVGDGLLVRNSKGHYKIKEKIMEMRGLKYIAKFREYLDYLEERLNNVEKAYNEIIEKCSDMDFVSNPFFMGILDSAIRYHDTSKFSKEEFTGYRKAFFPVTGEEGYQLVDEWEHHKKCNSHHHESLKIDVDVIHMIIDWTAMGYKFGDTAEEYYSRNKDKINLTREHKEFMLSIFKRLRR